MGSGGVCVSIPGEKLVAGANAREHWSSRKKRAERQVGVSRLVLARHAPPPFPVDVVITRVGPNPLDSDNLAGAAKHVRDGVASWLGVDDGKGERAGLVRWLYAQRRATKGEPKYAVEVRVEARAS